MLSRWRGALARVGRVSLEERRDGCTRARRRRTSGVSGRGLHNRAQAGAASERRGGEGALWGSGEDERRRAGSRASARVERQGASCEMVGGQGGRGSWRAHSSWSASSLVRPQRDLHTVPRAPPCQALSSRQHPRFPLGLSPLLPPPSSLSPSPSPPPARSNPRRSHEQERPRPAHRAPRPPPLTAQTRVLLTLPFLILISPPPPPPSRTSPPAPARTHRLICANPSPVPTRVPATRRTSSSSTCSRAPASRCGSLTTSSSASRERSSCVGPSLCALSCLYLGAPAGGHGEGEAHATRSGGGGRAVGRAGQGRRRRGATGGAGRSRVRGKTVRRAPCSPGATHLVQDRTSLTPGGPARARSLSSRVSTSL